MRRSTQPGRSKRHSTGKVRRGSSRGSAIPLVCSDLTFGLTVGDSSCYRWSSRPCFSWGVVHRSSGARTVDWGITPHVARLGQDEGTPARKEVAMNETPVFVGIDVAKATLEVAVRPSGAQWASANEEAGIQTLLGQLRALAPALVVLEATGGYEHAVAARSAPLPERRGNWPRRTRSMPRSWRCSLSAYGQRRGPSPMTPPRPWRPC